MQTYRLVHRPMWRFLIVLVVALAGVGCTQHGGVKAAKAPHSSSPFCVQALRYAQQFRETFDKVEGDNEAFEEAFGELSVALDHLESLAPTALQADVTLVREGLGKYRTVLARYEFNIDEVPENERTLDDPAIVAANNRVEKYLESDCGIKADAS